MARADANAVDPCVRSIRRRIAITVTRRVLVTIALVAAGSAGALMAWLERDAADAIPIALLIGQAAGLVRIAFALTTNDLPFSYLRRYLAAGDSWQPCPAVGAPHATAAALGDLGFSSECLVTARREEAGDVGAIDLFAHRNGMAIAALGRTSGSLALITRLSDGRILQSDRHATIPTSGVVTNTVPRADPAGLLRRHQWALGQLAERGIRPGPTAPTAWIEAMRKELAAFDQLGPVAGAFVNLSGSRRVGRLELMLRPLPILKLAIPDLDRVPRRDRLRLRVERVPVPA